MAEGEAAGERGAVRAHLELLGGYRFRVGFGPGRPELLMDEPVPLGEGAGPNASAVLGAAVANCLSASLLFCLRKARIEVRGLQADVEVATGRNERGRLRVSSVKVELRPEVAAADAGRLERCLGLFEDFCVVSAAVREGIGVEVSVQAAEAT